ncbi:MAG: CHC2 zinc finger domain-containing protein [Moraxella sp.]|nr:CHC2 zinc finger domain-containing protein [Moraxella sp.]
MSINGTHGGYICHACHAKGNMIGFYMRMTNSDYKTAMIQLGAYDE